MYKILIKTKSSRKYYSVYKIWDEENEQEIDYVAYSLEDLADKYKELLNDYTISELKATQELEPEVLVEIIDSI